MATVQQWLATAGDIARFDREMLLCETLNLNRAQILAFPERPLAPAEQSRLDAKLANLRDGTPLAYLLGHREFWGLSLQVSRAVLIPRPETELLVELTVKLAPADGHVLELGTGSGAISIAVASERHDLIMTATDICSSALAIAETNARTHNVRVNFITSNWYANLSGKWDVIVVNPPYIAEHDPHLPALHAEPQHALVAADNGLGAIRTIVSESGKYLQSPGHLVVEHGYDQADMVRDVMTGAGFHAVYSEKDLAQIERATIGRMGRAAAG